MDEWRTTTMQVSVLICTIGTCAGGASALSGHCCLFRASHNSLLAPPFYTLRFLVLFLLGFIMIAQQTLSLVDCLPQKNGLMTLRSEPISYCFDAKWFRTFFPLGIASIVFYCGILVLINVQINKNMEHLQVHTSLVFRSLNGWYVATAPPHHPPHPPL